MAETTRTSAGDFLTEVREEVKKVTWPDQEQLKNATFVIIVFGTIVALTIFVMDFGVRAVLNLLASLLGG